MDNVEWANINTFKDKYCLDSKGDGKGENDEELSETEENVESDNESISSKDNESLQLEIFKKILPFLKPGETILKAIKRLGESSKSCTDNSSKAGLSASQRWLKKKTPVGQTGKANIDPAQAKAAKESLEALTGHANYFIDRGYYDIYEETYEKLNFKIKSADSKKEATDSFDIFADEVDEKNIGASTSGANANLIEGKFRLSLYLYIFAINFYKNMFH